MLDRPWDTALRSRRSRLPINQEKGVIVELVRMIQDLEIFTDLKSWR